MTVVKNKVVNNEDLSDISSGLSSVGRAPRTFQLGTALRR